MHTIITPEQGHSGEGKTRATASRGIRKLSRAEQIQIVEKASTLHERLHGDWVPAATQTDAAMIQARLDAWRQSAAKGDAKTFAKRLQWEGWTVDTVLPALGDMRFPAEAPLPDWAHTLNDILAQVASIDPAHLETDAVLRAGQQVPFKECYLPFIHVARQYLAVQAQETLSLLGNEARTQLELVLLQRLARHCFRAVELEFSIFRATRQQSGLSMLIRQLQGGSSQELYQAFVHEMVYENLPAFFKEYAVLARLSVCIMAFWVDASREFLQRLAQDLPLIQQTFNLASPGRVEALKPSLSDPHNQGRSVIGMKFESGFKLIYKPKDVAAEAHYFKLLEWVNEQQACLPFRTLKVIQRGPYGWVEYADTFACQTAEELQRYYQRSGALLALLYTLRGTDFHFENVLACGDQA